MTKKNYGKIMRKSFSFGLNFTGWQILRTQFGRASVVLLLLGFHLGEFTTLSPAHAVSDCHHTGIPLPLPTLPKLDEDKFPRREFESATPLSQPLGSGKTSQLKIAQAAFCKRYTYCSGGGSIQCIAYGAGAQCSVIPYVSVTCVGVDYYGRVGEFYFTCR